VGTASRELKAMTSLLGGLPPLRDYWREINRLERAAEDQARAERKARDKKRRKCLCEAYPWPHRPGGGFCRWPDPPLERYQRPARSRAYHRRYQGLRRRVARANGLHPIRDRKRIEELMPRVLAQARMLKRQCPKLN
jgi:hypothetical protein